jgi:hypothetical protein
MTTDPFFRMRKLSDVWSWVHIHANRSRRLKERFFGRRKTVEKQSSLEAAVAQGELDHHRRCPDVPHTRVHHVLRRTLETAQDAIVVVLLVMLLAVMAQALWNLGLMIIQPVSSYPSLVSQIVFVLILAELYRVQPRYM